MDAMTIKQVAEKLGVTPSVVYALCKRRSLAHFRIGPNRGAIRVSQAQLDAYLTASEVAVEQPANGCRNSSKQQAALLPDTRILDRFRSKKRGSNK